MTAKNHQNLEQIISQATAKSTHQGALGTLIALAEDAKDPKQLEAAVKALETHTDANLSTWKKEKSQSIASKKSWNMLDRMGTTGWVVVGLGIAAAAMAVTNPIFLTVALAAMAVECARSIFRESLPSFAKAFRQLKGQDPLSKGQPLSKRLGLAARSMAFGATTGNLGILSLSVAALPMALEAAGIGLAPPIALALLVIGLAVAAGTVVFTAVGYMQENREAKEESELALEQIDQLKSQLSQKHSLEPLVKVESQPGQQGEHMLSKDSELALEQTKTLESQLSQTKTMEPLVKVEPQPGQQVERTLAKAPLMAHQATHETPSASDTGQAASGRGSMAISRNALEGAKSPANDDSQNTRNPVSP